MVAMTGPLPALTARDLMSPGVVTISQDTPLRAAAQVFFQLRIEEAAVVDSGGRCVGTLSATDLIRWALGGAGGAAGDALAPACPYQVRGRLLTGEDAAICMRAEGSCPLQEVRPMTGGRHTVVCLLRGGPVSDWQQVSVGVPAAGVRRYMTADVPAVGPDATLTELGRVVIDAHVHRLVVVDQQQRPIGTVSRLDVLAALTDRGSSAVGR
jgi:CBS domain-containing protein